MMRLIPHTVLDETFLVSRAASDRRVGQARFERRPTIGKRREFMVGRRGEAPLVPPYKFRRPNKAMALEANKE